MVEYLEVNNYSDVKKIAKINKSLKLNKCNIIAIYLPGCIHCKLLHPQWRIAANKMNNRNGIISFINTKFSHKLNVDTSNVYGYPHIFAIKNKKYIEYNGPRDNRSLYKWMSSMCLKIRNLQKNNQKSNQESNQKTTKRQIIKKLVEERIKIFMELIFL